MSVRPRTILIADESVPVRTVLADILVKLGQPPDTILAASTRQAALDAFLRHRPDIVFTEVRMEGESTLELIEALLAQDPRLKVILLTAESRLDEDVREAIRHGAFDHVEKPLRLEKIRSVMNAILVEEGGVERLR